MVYLSHYEPSDLRQNDHAKGMSAIISKTKKNFFVAKPVIVLFFKPSFVWGAPAPAYPFTGKHYFYLANVESVSSE